jgi:hypothetical protein
VTVFAPLSIVIPAKAGIFRIIGKKIPAFAGMTMKGEGRI